MLALIAKNIGQGNGASLSALDVLISLGQIDPHLTLIYLYKNNIPEELDGKKIHYSQSYLSPRIIDNSSILNIKNYPNYVLNPILMNRLKKISPTMSLINSMGSHSLWKPIKDTFNWQGTLIIRESPDLYNKKTLEKVLDRFNYYKYFIFVSDIVRKKWFRFNVIDNSNSFYIPNCIWENDVKKISQISKSILKKKIYGDQNSFISICPGEIKNRKGQDLIIDNISEICKLIPNFKLFLLGRKNKIFVNNLFNKLKASEYSQRVEIISHQPNALEYIYAADVLLQPSRSEALPRTILEAMALKTPIIASDVDGIPELVKDNSSAILFSPSDLNKMVTGLFKVYTDSSFTSQITDNAHNRYWNFFSRDNHIKNYSNFINQLPHAKKR